MIRKRPEREQRIQPAGHFPGPSEEDRKADLVTGSAARSLLQDITLRRERYDLAPHPPQILAVSHPPRNKLEKSPPLN